MTRWEQMSRGSNWSNVPPSSAGVCLTRCGPLPWIMNQTRRKSIGNADYERSAWRVLITIGLLTKFDFVSSFSHFEKIKMV
jgi:hypothetical protein